MTTKAKKVPLNAAGSLPCMSADPVAAASRVSLDYALAAASKLSLPEESHVKTSHQRSSASSVQEDTKPSGWSFGVDRLRNVLKGKLPNLPAFMV